MVEKAWLAGILEADGSFRRHDMPNGRYRLYVSLEMVDEDTVRHARDLTGLGGIQVRNRPDPKWQTTYAWAVQAKQDVLDLISELEPFIVASRRHAQIAAMRK